MKQKTTNVVSNWIKSPVETRRNFSEVLKGSTLFTFDKMKDAGKVDSAITLPTESRFLKLDFGCISVYGITYYVCIFCDFMISIIGKYW